MKKNFLHELRNRLTVIKGNLDLASGSEVSAEAKKFLDEAKAEFSRLKILLDEQEK